LIRASRGRIEVLPAPFHVQFGFCIAIVKRQVSVECVVDGVADVARQMKPGRQDVSPAARALDSHDALHRMVCAQICLAMAGERQNLFPMGRFKVPRQLDSSCRHLVGGPLACGADQGSGPGRWTAPQPAALEVDSTANRAATCSRCLVGLPIPGVDRLHDKWAPACRPHSFGLRALFHVDSYEGEFLRPAADQNLHRSGGG